MFLTVNPVFTSIVVLYKKAQSSMLCMNGGISFLDYCSVDADGDISLGS
jgi:hypothetical protein